MKKIIKDHWRKFIVILIFPFILDWILRFIWWIDISIKESASVGEWLGFLGAYFGVIGAIAVVWWQHIENKKQFEKQLAEMQIESQKEMFEKQLNEEKSRRQQNISSYIKYTSGEYLDFIRNNLSYFFSLLYLTISGNEQTIFKLANNLLKISIEIDIDNYPQ